jgi:hypothetical protein
MPEHDEDALKSLMIRGTEDLTLRRDAAHQAIVWQRRRRARVRVVSVAGAAAAAGLAAGFLVPDLADSPASPQASAAHSPASSPAPAARPSERSTARAGTTIRLTAVQRALFSLSAAAAATPRPVGRYVVLTERATTITPNGGSAPPAKEIGGETNVIDTLTGAVVEYQDITVTNGEGTPTPPRELKGGPGTAPTRAQLDAMPTGTAALRAALLAQARKQEQQSGETADDLVFEQATSLLWQPHVGPALRSALYKVLAATADVVVRTGATDSSGRPATEISRYDVVIDQTSETFEDPQTGATLESAWVGPWGTFAEDLYQSIRYTGTIPADPYK